MTRSLCVLLWFILLMPTGAFAQGAPPPIALPDTPVGKAVVLTNDDAPAAEDLARKIRLGR